MHAYTDVRSKRPRRADENTNSACTTEIYTPPTIIVYSV